MGTFYRIELDSLGQATDGGEKCHPMSGEAFDVVKGMASLRDLFSAKLAEHPTSFVYEYSQDDMPAVTLRWRLLAAGAGSTVVIYESHVIASMLLLAGTNPQEETDAIVQFESQLLMNRRGVAVAPAYDLKRFVERPLAIRVIWQRRDETDRPFDLAEWCLAAAFFRAEGVI